MAWNETDEGKTLVDAYDYLIDTYQTILPNHKASLDAIAERPITG